MNKSLIVVAGMVGCLFAQTRPRDPFIFRTAIAENGNPPSNQKNRLVGLLLNANFTAFYSTQTGEGTGLYMARSGTANDGNVTYSHTQFGQCITFTGGTVFHRNTTATLWEILNNGTPATSQAVYKGFTHTNAAGTTAALRYDVTAGATTVSISESPEYVAGGNGGLRRTMVVTGLGANQSLRVRLTGTTAVGETWTANSGGTLTGTNPQYFTIAANGTAVVTGNW